MKVAVIGFWCVVLCCSWLVCYYYYLEESQRHRYSRAVAHLLRRVSDQMDQPNLQILDLGGGTGEISDSLRKLGHTTVLLDVHQHRPDTIVYDGVTIPWPDDSFQVCVCSFVLHHTTQAERLLGEMARVAPWILILEDLPDQGTIPALSYYLTQLHYVWFGQSCDMVQHIHTDRKWRQLFARAGLTVWKSLDISETIVYPVPHRAYLLTKLT